MAILDHYPTVPKPAWFNPARLQADEIKLCGPLAAERGSGVVSYLRTGGCTAGCGACCEAFVVPVDVNNLAHAEYEPVVHGRVHLPIPSGMEGKAGYSDWEHWLTLHDAWLLQMPSGLLTLQLPVEAKRPAPARDLDAWVSWLGAHGISAVRRFEQLLAYIPAPCRELTADKLCGAVGTMRRPHLCSAYPVHPLDIEGLDFCTYRFDPVSQSQITEIATSARRRPPPPQRKGKKKRKKGRR